MKNIDFPRSGVGPPNFQILPLIFLEPPLRNVHFHAADEIPQKLKSCQHLEFVKLNEPELSNLFGVHGAPKWEEIDADSDDTDTDGECSSEWESDSEGTADIHKILASNLLNGQQHINALELH